MVKASKKKKSRAAITLRPMPEVDKSTNERLECDVCGKTYSTKGSLRTHKYHHRKQN